MVNFLLLVLFVGVTLNAGCLDKQESYTIMPHGKNEQHYYQMLAVSLSKAKVFTNTELKKALSTNAGSDISFLLHAIAYDEVGNCEEMEKNILSIKDPQRLFEIFPEAGLAIADIYLRVERFEEIIELLPKDKTLRLGNEIHQRANYYIAMSKYLLGDHEEQELRIAKNKFRKAKQIYNERHSDNALYKL